MTETTGSDKKPQSNPWEQNWNDVKATVSKATEAVKPVLETARKPWEMMWVDPTAKVSKPSVAPPKPSLGGDWDSINSSYKAGQTDRDKQRLDLLNGELSNETNPKNREMLKREISRTEKLLKGKKNG